jgi:hypothetical protein
MFRAKSLELLARICRPQLRDRSVNQMDGALQELVVETIDLQRVSLPSRSDR